MLRTQQTLDREITIEKNNNLFLPTTSSKAVFPLIEEKFQRTEPIDRFLQIPQSFSLAFAAFFFSLDLNPATPLILFFYQFQEIGSDRSLFL